MTTDNALAKFAELSPEQRQLLFEKIRQKKLSDARKPVDNGAPTEGATLSPHQAYLLEQLEGQTLTNRVWEIRLSGDVTQADLQNAINLMAPNCPSLCSRFDGSERTFTQTDNALVVNFKDLSGQGEAEQAQALATLQDQHKNHGHQEQCLQVTLIDCGNQQHRLLLSAHPLLLDSYSLLRLANQILSLISGSVDLATLTPKESCQQRHFATWSQQVLEKKFLRNEWTRLAPPSLKEGKTQAPVIHSENHLHQLNGEFIQTHGQHHLSAKQWVCSALHECLSSWLSYNDVTYWFFDPLLKDNEFDNLLGYFPYYVPVKAQTDEAKEFNVTAQLSQLHTRYAAVSEHLAQQLCVTGSQMPMLHYHWFDLGDTENAAFQVEAIDHIHSGVMLAAIEIHVTEQSNGISLNVHFDTQKLGTDQVQFLLRELLALLKQDKNIDPSKRPSLPEQLRGIWKELLQVPEIAPEQSFFELGGHSLQVTEMKFRIKQQLKVDIPISVLYELPTIEKLSSFILATHGNSLGIAPGADEDNDVEEEEGTL